MRTSTPRTLAVVLMTLLVAAPQAAASSADLASDSDSRWLDEYGANHLVVAGADEPGWSAGEARRFEYLAYYPTELQIHRGDVVFFRIDRLHTVTFGPQGQPREGALRRDEVEPAVAIQHDLPSDPTCGTSAEAPPCVLDSTGEFVNSGSPTPREPAALKLAVDLPEGAYTYYCALHPGMEGTIEVVPDEQPIATPAEVEADRQAEIAADTAAAVDLLENPPAVRDPELVPASGTSPAHRRWFVHAGEVTPDQRVAVLLYFPPRLEIEPGDEVTFEVPAVGAPPPGRTESVAEFHTVTFEPKPIHDRGLPPVHYFNPMCDPDDPETGLPGVPLFAALLVGCPAGSTLEYGLQPWAYQDPLRAPDDAVATEATLHDSGLLVPPDIPCRSGCDPWTGERLSSTLTASFPNEGEFVFRCQLHRPMRGTVTVSG